MKILIPMAGAGTRFANAGYKVHKPAIKTYDRHTGQLLPMAVCAVRDLPGVEKDGANVIFIDREFHKTGGVEQEILQYYPKASFVTVRDLTEGQACTCLLAKELLAPEESLLIAGCDNGMDMNLELFKHLCTCADELVFTYRHNEAVNKNPDAYGWMKVNENNEIIDVSIKKAISDTPCEDQAVVATFWFKKAEIFIKAAEKMINEQDRIKNEFYVDEVVKHVLELGYHAKVFEVDRYVGWGTPSDYEEFQKTYEYWRNFLENEKIV